MRHLTETQIKAEMQKHAPEGWECGAGVDFTGAFLGLGLSNQRLLLTTKRVVPEWMLDWDIEEFRDRIILPMCAAARQTTS